jgi:hydroxymethylpyrimidine/phosphomethylpyrimidine kinase
MAERSVLLIGGHDPSGQAGLLADVEAVRRAGVAPRAVVTCLTAQSDAHCSIFPVAAPTLAAQLAALGPFAVTKVGMVPTEALAAVLLDLDGERVVDPVLATSSGVRCAPADPLSGAYAALWQGAALLTPNLPEAVQLTGLSPSTDPLEMASALCRAGCARVLIKGGHGAGDTVCDIFLDRDGSVTFLRRPRLAGSLRGTGCRLASAIAARRALGDEWEAAVRNGVAAHDRQLAERLAAAAQ